MKKLVMLIAMLAIAGLASAALVENFSGDFTDASSIFTEADTTAGWNHYPNGWSVYDTDKVRFNNATRLKGMAQSFTDARTGTYTLAINWKQVNSDSDGRAEFEVWGFATAAHSVLLSGGTTPAGGTLVANSAVLGGEFDYLTTAEEFDIELNASYDHYVIRIMGAKHDAADNDYLQVNNVSVGGDSVGDAVVGTVFTIK